MRALIAVIASLLAGAALAQQPPPGRDLRQLSATPTAAPAGMEILFAPQAEHVVFDGTHLILDGISPVVPFFVDRPLRIAGAITPEQFVEIWGLSEQSLKIGPPVATIAVVSASRAPSPIVELRSVSVSGRMMTFEARLVSGDLPEAAGPVALMFRPRLWWPRWREGFAARQPSAVPTGPDIACFMTFAMGQSICHGVSTPRPLPAPPQPD